MSFTPAHRCANPTAVIRLKPSKHEPEVHRGSIG
jgi:hypothetical protein